MSNKTIPTTEELAARERAIEKVVADIKGDFPDLADVDAYHAAEQYLASLRDDA